MVAGNSVAITGAVIGLLSLPLGWLTVKPNRIVAGTGLNLWDSLGWNGAVILFVLWIACLLFVLAGRNKMTTIAAGVTSVAIVIFTFFFVGMAAGRLLACEEEFARVSLGAGVWTTLAGTYMVTFAVRRDLEGSAVWQLLLTWGGIASIIIFLFSGWLGNLSIIQEFTGREERFIQELLRHVFLFGVSVGISTIIGISLGVWAARSNRAEKPIFYTTNITQTIPSLALFGLLIAPLSALSFSFPVLREFGIRGVGIAPAMIALVIYSLLPIVRNTFVSLRQLAPAVIDAGKGMGMSRFQIFSKIEVPLAAPLVLEGVRTASVQAVGLATVAALIGAGGLGWFIFRGIGQAAPDLIILGAIPIIVLALAVDLVMRTIVKLATPKGLQAGKQ
ncbi:ABC transporter permease [Chloroflexota bacterium]